MPVLKKTLLPILLLSLLILRFSFVMKSPLYLDEGIYISWADMFHQSRDAAYFSLQDGKTPLFYWILGVAGPLFNNYLLAGRLISVAAGLITALCWTIIFYHYFNIKKTVIALFLFLITPYGFLVERTALTDSLLMAFSSLSLLFLLLSKLWLDKKSGSRLIPFLSFFILSGIWLGFAYGTKTTARLFLMINPLIVFIWIMDYLKNKEFKKVIWMLLGLILMFGFYREIVGYFRLGGHTYWHLVAEKEKLMIYSPNEIIKRLIDNPLSIFNYFGLWLQYIGFYVSGILVFTSVGVIKLISGKEDRKFWWLIFYWLISSAAVCLSGKVMASRYVYVSYPIIMAISVFGVDFLLSSKNKIFHNIAYLMLFLAFGQSCLLVFKPENALYAEDDQSYLVSGNLTALGLPDVIKYLDNKNKNNILVGLDGSWGLPDGVGVLLGQDGFKSRAVSTEKMLLRKDPMDKKCDDGWVEKEKSCWKIDTDANYLYVVGNDEAVARLVNAGAEKRLEFNRHKGSSKNYLLEIPIN